MIDGEQMHFSDDDRRRANKMLASSRRSVVVTGNRRVMEADSIAFRDDLKQIEKCGDPWPCRRSACIRCAAGVRTPQEGGANDRFERGLVHSATNPIRWATPGSFIRSKGAWMADPFHALPWSETSPVRITHGLLDANGDPARAFRAARRYLTEVLHDLFPTAIARGFGELAGVHANARYSTLPEELVSPSIWQSGFADQPAFLLHSNLALHHAGEGFESAFQKLVQAFPGTDQVWVGNFKAAKYDENGFQSGGIEGWGEYSGFELKELNFLAPKENGSDASHYDPYQPHENDNAAVAHTRLLLLEKWPRSMRNIKYRDHEQDIIEAVVRAWFPGMAVPELNELPIQTVPKEQPKETVAQEVIEPMSVSSFISLHLSRGPRIDAWLDRQHGPFSLKPHTIKRSLCWLQKIAMISMPEKAQVHGFCQRPGIERPP